MDPDPRHGRRNPPAFFAWLVIGACVLLAPASVKGQIISPGKLSQAHSFLEGLSNCTQCHELGNPSIENTACTDCHTPIEASLREGSGLHGQPDIAEQSCASCHKEHFGRTFDVLRFDRDDFDHASVGFPLDGAHAELECADCHAEESYRQDSVVAAWRIEYDLQPSDSTFLGLDGECASCHMPDNVHGAQFGGVSCADCHTTAEWVDAERFDHDRARFPLTGEHLEVTCESCHAPSITDPAVTAYRGLAFESCSDCHEDVHDGRLSRLDGETTDCETCHLTDGWHLFGPDFPEQAFPHEETGYPLLGRHETVACATCHTPGAGREVELTYVSSTVDQTYPEPLAETCMSCHVDYHDGVFVADDPASDCASCHTPDGWYPSQFGLREHAEQSRFALTGAHLVTPCQSCHGGETHDPGTSQGDKPVFRFADTQCEACHAQDNPHGDLAALDLSGSTPVRCEECHSTTNWSPTDGFDHGGRAGYALIGAHLSVDCRSCHFPDAGGMAGIAAVPAAPPPSGGAPVHLTFSSVGQDCASCHQADSPHQGQFENSAIGAACDGCHTPDSFILSSFDHSLTRFPLDGGHANVACVSCHASETAPDGTVFTRFHPLSTDCSSCHGQ